MDENHGECPFVQVTLQQYDPALSSTDTILPCTDAACGNNAQCTSVNSPGDACAYSVRYGDQSTTQGYIINDVITFRNSATTTASANVHFGQHYNVLMENIAVNGVNVTDAASLLNPPSNLGVIMDSGTTLAYLMQRPAYNKFVAAIEAGAPGAPKRIPEGTRGAYLLCCGSSAE